ncbi:unnamed protein product [Gordionus sp. m RMFG-2023]|uniref:alpha-(1,3)-fucosyltransferase fut-5-like isoform X3 n=1 Tax=Gordionus sp. m RMFG-2023 TaxID=3053472 RepID=UPI0030E45F06
MLNKLPTNQNILFTKRRCYYITIGIFITILVFQDEHIFNSSNFIREDYKKISREKAFYSPSDNITKLISNQTRFESNISLLTNVTYDKTKNIILWTAFHTDITWDIKDLGKAPFKDCEYTSCDISNNKSYFSNVDALLFHVRDIKGFPLNRSNNQIWIFFNMESPVHTYGNLTSYDYIFNWTITYLPQSDIYNPYNSTAMKRKSKVRNTNNINYSYGKIELAIIVVSNCNTNNNRLETTGARSLDVRGVCSMNFLNNSALICYSNKEPTEVCMKRYLSRYKFYLAFENSNCAHYITEKFFRALSVGTVPVVFGARYSDYVRVAPPFSFIFVASPLAITAGVMGDFVFVILAAFQQGNQSQNSSIPNINLEIPKNHPYFHSNNMNELVKYLLKLDSNDTLYNEYHAWREEYIIVGKKNKYLCSICEHLHLKDIPNKSYKISDWWNKERDCKD